MPEPTHSHEAPRRTRGFPPLSRVIMALLLAGLAFAITIQISDDGKDDYASVRGEDLVELLKSLDAANERLGTQIDELTETRNGLLNSTQRSARAKEQAKLRAEQLAILAGTTGATGPGVELVIRDPGKKIDAPSLLDTIAELRDAGAEAIVINGVARVVAQTAFLDDEDQIRVGGQEIKRPYRIEAIGDSQNLAEALGIRGGVVDRVAIRGGSATINKKDKVTITALADVKSPEYAQPTS